MEKGRKIMPCPCLPCRRLKKVALTRKSYVGLWIDKELQHLFMYLFVANIIMLFAPGKAWDCRPLTWIVGTLAIATFITFYHILLYYIIFQYILLYFIKFHHILSCTLSIHYQKQMEVKVSRTPWHLQDVNPGSNGQWDLTLLLFPLMSRNCLKGEFTENHGIPCMLGGKKPTWFPMVLP